MAAAAGSKVHKRMSLCLYVVRHVTRGEHAEGREERGEGEGERRKEPTRTVREPKGRERERESKKERKKERKRKRRQRGRKKTECWGKGVREREKCHSRSFPLSVCRQRRNCSLACVHETDSSE